MKKLIEEPSLIQSQTRITIECMKCYDFLSLHHINAVIQCETWISTHTEQNKSIAHKPVTTNRMLTRGAVGTRGMGHFSRVAVHKLLAAS